MVPTDTSQQLILSSDLDVHYADKTVNETQLTALKHIATKHIEIGALTTEHATDMMLQILSGKKLEWPMLEIKPIPCYVMKLKDSNGCKFFINVCSHGAIRSDTTYVIPIPMEYVAADGSSCVVYDAVISQDDADMCVVDKNKLNTVAKRILDAVAAQSGKPIPPQEPGYPKTRNNYKASTQSSTIDAVLVPNPNYEKCNEGADPKVVEAAGIDNGHVDEVSPPVEFACSPVAFANDDNGTYILPEASFVMKTRRSDGIKYFINITDHDDIPVGRITTSSAIAKESISKDGSTCHVYDVCLNRDYSQNILGNQSDLGDQQREEVLSQYSTMTSYC